jgi:hypothetical protein
MFDGARYDTIEQTREFARGYVNRERRALEPFPESQSK